MGLGCRAGPPACTTAAPTGPRHVPGATAHAPPRLLRLRGSAAPPLVPPDPPSSPARRSRCAPLGRSASSDVSGPAGRRPRARMHALPGQPVRGPPCPCTPSTRLSAGRGSGTRRAAATAPSSVPPRWPAQLQSRWARRRPLAALPVASMCRPAAHSSAVQEEKRACVDATATKVAASAAGPTSVRKAIASLPACCSFEFVQLTRIPRESEGMPPLELRPGCTARWAYNQSGDFGDSC